MIIYYVPNSDNFVIISWSLYLIQAFKSNPITGLDRPWEFQKVEAPRFQDSQHMKVVRLLALYTGHLYPKEVFLGRVDPRAIMRPGRIISMKNSNDTIGNRTRNFPGL